ncbi:MAG TPA: hypothetical protein P5121_08805 [Caldilineaceae bacterium]|nr:hypothetical protein [Caldilineaceae bacterium]
MSQFWKQTVQIALIAGAVTLSAAVIGLIETFDQRDIIAGILTLGEILLFAAAPVAGYICINRLKTQRFGVALLQGLVAGLVVVLPVWGLLVLNSFWESIREAFINVSPALIEILTLRQPSAITGVLLLGGSFALLGVIGALFARLPKLLQRSLLTGIGWVIGLGLLSEILVDILRPRIGRPLTGVVFGAKGLHLTPTLVIFATITILTFVWRQWGGTQYQRVRGTMSSGQLRWAHRIQVVLGVIILLILPSFVGVYLSEIINNIGLYILMGLGLNIAIGLAGLLDLGYVTNFAVGAYIMAILTSSSPLGIEQSAGFGGITFWMALPISVAAAMLTGFILALPVLRMRGDYLAITTLGFGEIIRILARSDWLKPIIGGAQGILLIPQAAITGWFSSLLSFILVPIETFLSRFGITLLAVNNQGDIVFDTPPQLYYLLVLACLFMLFISVRLNGSRIGRQWMAMREDEDVAGAMGIDTTKAKIIAFTLSAASGGLAGAIFAAKLGSIYPHSFQLLISINVLALIIVGGMGSIPGIVVGAFALIGLPELLREFAEFRLLFYGIALMAMMLVRPEGLWPSATRRRELQSTEPLVEQTPTRAGEAHEAVTIGS